MARPRVQPVQLTVAEVRQIHATQRRVTASLTRMRKGIKTLMEEAERLQKEADNAFDKTRS